MIHLPDLIRDLSIILITASFISILFKRFNQPVVLGYLLAGFFVGPNFSFFFTVNDHDSIKTWAELGVIILLFSLGLEFNLRKLSAVGKTSAITGLIEVSGMALLGYSIGSFLNFTVMESIFLGAMISISSTSIILKAVEELNLKSKKYVQSVFGVLIIEDLVAILFLVLVSAFSVTRTFSGELLIIELIKVIFYIVTWFVVGMYIIPTFFRKIRKHINEEILILTSLGLCLLMVVSVTKVGFSPALGAFLMGMILGETEEGKKIDHLILPIKNLFLAVFFVSIGMLIDLKMISDSFSVIAIISLGVIFGKILFVSVGAIASGKNLKDSIHMGFTQAQIGEFSFIITSLGVSLNLISNKLYPLAISVSVITTFLTPYLIKLSPKVFTKVSKIIPQQFFLYHLRYLQALETKTKAGMFSLILKTYGIRTLVNSLLIISLILVANQFYIPLSAKYFLNENIQNLFGLVIFTFLALPFLWGLVLGHPDLNSAHELEKLSKLKELTFGITFIRAFIGIGFLVILLSQFIEIEYAFLLTLLVLIITGYLFKSKLSLLYQKIESRFLSNLTDSEKKEIAKVNLKPKLTPWNAVMSNIVLHPDSKFCGMTIANSKIKDDFNVMIALIERGSKKIFAPKADEVLMAFDEVFFVGAEENLEKIMSQLNKAVTIDESTLKDEYGLSSILISSTSPFVNLALKDSQMREKIHGMIVGIERDGQRILTPEPTFILKENDLVWLVGDMRMIDLVSKL